jgi:hypothetical protein
MDACTSDACDPGDGACAFTPVTCDDLDACDGLETCDPVTGDCRPGTPVSCDDMDACTTDACDPADGTCSFAAVTCDDMDACTTDTCDPASGCQVAPISCDDMDACTVESCDPALGCQATPISCDDMDACTTDTCDPATGCRSVPVSSIGTAAQLAGNALSQYPWFEHVRAFNVNAGAEVGLDPARYPGAAGRTCDVYVLTHRSVAEWCADASLVDARGAPDARGFPLSGTAASRFPLIAPGQLPASAGDGLGAPYDVVLDCNRNGVLDDADVIDGFGIEAGLYVVHDLTQQGPHGTNSFDDIGPAPDCTFPLWFPEGDDVRIYYPAELDDPSFAGTFPLVMISHGNGHCFDRYDDLQAFLASYGYVVAAHDNNTPPGIETASSSTLYWTDRVIDLQGTLGGGVLDGHVDDTRITWIGHSRGGEGVVRAYDRLHDEGFTPQHFTIDDIRIVSSMAPTDFLGGGQSDPHDVAYDLVFGAADADVNGCAADDIGQSFNLYERGTGTKTSFYLQGVGHGFLHDCGDGEEFGDGPDRLACPDVHAAQKGHYLPLLKRHLEGNVPAKDFFWRQYESLRPVGVTPAAIVDLDYKDAVAAGNQVIDDYQTQPGTGTASSGATVTFDVTNVVEGLLDDGDGNFDWVPADPMNGMTRANVSVAPNDTQRGVVLDWPVGGARFYEYQLPPGSGNLLPDAYIQLRACQGTRHPNTTAELGDLTFTVTLVDGAGAQSSIAVDAYGGGCEEPYQRLGCGPAGVGWANEFEVVRIRLADFLNDGSGLDLADVARIRLDFGDGFGSAQGRIGIDDVQVAPQ